jgi:hypothetical protein
VLNKVSTDSHFLIYYKISQLIHVLLHVELMLLYLGLMLLDIGLVLLNVWNSAA